MESYSLHNRNQKSRVNRAYVQEYLDYGIHQKEEGFDTQHRKLRTLSSSMIPKNLVYHTKHSIEVKKERLGSKNDSTSKTTVLNDTWVKDFEACTPSNIEKYKTIKGLAERVAKDLKTRDKAKREKSLISDILTEHKMTSDEK